MKRILTCAALSAILLSGCSFSKSGIIQVDGKVITKDQFDKAIDKNSTVYKAAREALNGADPTNGCIFFYNPKTTKSKWLYTRTTVITIGSHRFAK